MAPSSPGRRDYLCLTKIIKRHFHWNICRLKFAGIFGCLTTRDCMKLTSCQSMKKYEYFVSNSPGRGRDCWWRPLLWCSPEGARRCAGSSCWSPGSPRRSHLFSSSHQNTPENTFVLHEGGPNIFTFLGLSIVFGLATSLDASSVTSFLVFLSNILKRENGCEESTPD